MFFITSLERLLSSRLPSNADFPIMVHLQLFWFVPKLCHSIRPLRLPSAYIRSGYLELRVAVSSQTLVEGTASSVASGRSKHSGTALPRAGCQRLQFSTRHWPNDCNPQSYCCGAVLEMGRVSRSATSAFISAISRTWAAIMPSASLRTRGSRMRARLLVIIAIE